MAAGDRAGSAKKRIIDSITVHVAGEGDGLLEIGTRFVTKSGYAIESCRVRYRGEAVAFSEDDGARSQQVIVAIAVQISSAPDIWSDAERGADITKSITSIQRVGADAGRERG